jgi:hypothetical protein
MTYDIQERHREGVLLMLNTLGNFLLDEVWPGLLLLWLCLHVPIALISTAPLWYLWRKRAKWTRWNLTVFVFPYFTWASLFVLDASEKAWGNVTVEPMLVGFGCVCQPLTRIVLENRIRESRAAWLGTLAACIVGSLVNVLVPELRVE